MTEKTHLAIAFIVGAGAATILGTIIPSFKKQESQEPVVEEEIDWDEIDPMGYDRPYSYDAESQSCAWCKESSANLREVEYGGAGAICPTCHHLYRKLGYNPHKPPHPFKRKAESITPQKFRHKETGEVATQISLLDMKNWEKLDSETFEAWFDDSDADEKEEKEETQSIQIPTEFGRPIDWRPYDESVSALRHHKRAESHDFSQKSESFASDMEIGNTIYRQLGGNRFRVMTGAKNLTWDDKNNELSMKIGKNNLGANYLVVKLNPKDLYDMRFESRRWNRKTYDLNIKVKAEFTDIYADQLQNIFTEATGLYTRMAETFDKNAESCCSEEIWCCFCGISLSDIGEKHGHNPAPLAEFPNVCCGHCNTNVVIPARLQEIEDRYDAETVGADDEKCSVCGADAVHILKQGHIVLCDKHFQQQFGRYSAEYTYGSTGDTLIHWEDYMGYSSPSMPPLDVYFGEQILKGSVRTISGKPHKTRKLKKDKNITPEEAANRLRLDADER